MPPPLLRYYGPCAAKSERPSKHGRRNRRIRQRSCVRRVERDHESKTGSCRFSQHQTSNGTRTAHHLAGRMKKPRETRGLQSSPGRTRTYDLAVNSRSLYQLSYRGKCCFNVPSQLAWRLIRLRRTRPSQLSYRVIGVALVYEKSISSSSRIRDPFNPQNTSIASRRDSSSFMGRRVRQSRPPMTDFDDAPESGRGEAHLMI